MHSSNWFKFWPGFIFSIEMNEKIKPSQNLNHTQMKMWNVDELSWLMILFFENEEFLKVRIKYAYEYYKKKVRIRT